MKNNLIKSKNRGQTEADEKENGTDHSLQSLFLDELADVLHAEKQLTRALPKMAKAAKSEDLTAAFESHLSETQNQITRLEKVFASLDEPVKTKKCAAMEGLLEEGEELMEELEGTPALDAGLIAAAQKVEHYEIASYGTLCAWAEHMGHDEAAGLLKETLDEEKAADKKLSTLSSASNEKASGESDQSESEEDSDDNGPSKGRREGRKPAPSLLS
jgi:ferritin-like metal-binding protein YciE